MRIIIDGNSVLNANLLGGKDIEYGRTITTPEGKTVQVNSAQYGVDKFFAEINTLCDEFSTAPMHMVLVWDGMNAKAARQTHLEQYKAGRDKAPEVSAELNKARGICTETMLGLGAHVCEQGGLEADDVIGYLTKHLRDQRNTVVTSDGDLTVLCDENTDVWRLGKLNENPYGQFPHKYITLYKALVGDTSDKIPGAKGFGDAAWCDLVRVFGVESLEEVERLVKEDKLHELKDNIVDVPKLKNVIENKEMVTASWNCARLMIERVNTMRKPLSIRAGMVHQRGEDAYQPFELKRLYGTKTLVTADNYERAKAQFRHAVKGSPYVALDIETSSTEASDVWMEGVLQALDSDRDRIDALGHELTGMSLTFGDNCQHTIYMSVDHADTRNITVEQCRQMCELIPQDIQLVAHNRAFEFQVLYRAWGEAWKDNGWHGFLPNCVDTLIGASYVDENLSKGLKFRSKHHLGYEQTTYEATTTRSGPVGALQGGVRVGKVFEKEVAPCIEVPVDESGETQVIPAETEVWETRQYKMRELSAHEVFDYGCDDTICTAALHNHFRFIMEMENTWKVYLEVETLPQYLTSLAYVQGIEISTPKLIELEAKDNETYDKAWNVLRGFLMTKGWEGTACPVFTEVTPATVKEACNLVLGQELETRKRKLNAMAEDIRVQFPDSSDAETLAIAVGAENVEALNALVALRFTGEPKINFGSPKQMQNLFYRVLGLTPRIINKPTELQRKDPVIASAFSKLRKKKEGKPVTYTSEELDALIGKSSTDDAAVDTALALDTLTEEVKQVLKAYKEIKAVQTRRNLFYKTYKALPHWRDGRIHPALNQCEAATRRYSSSGPNVQQLPSKGEGAHFREILRPHHKDAVIVSMDFSSQELAVGAELSGDENMTACFVGDKPKDMHSLMAVAAAPYVWGESVDYEEFMSMRKSEDKEVSERAAALRQLAKRAGFALQYGAMAEKVAEGLNIPVGTAELLVKAREEAFPGIIRWANDVHEFAKVRGYTLTLMGARRHLAAALQSENRWDVEKAMRQAANFCIQSTSAEMTKLAMARVWGRGLCTEKYDAVFVAPIHDELVFSVNRNHALDFIKDAHACMVAPYSTMKIPMKSSIAVGKNFLAETEVGSDPSSPAIAETLQKLFPQPQEERKTA